jgi:multicomponent Na+:H+ antiporter subunit G
MGTVIDLLSWAALLGGGFFYVVGAVGLNRMPDLFTRMHAVSVSESLGIGLLILGMALQAGFTLVTVKLVIIMVVLMWTGSIATHALARAALHDGEKPLLIDADGKLVKTDPVDLFPALAMRLATPLVSESVDEAPAEVVMGADGPVDDNPSVAEANRDARPPAPGAEPGKGD